MQTPPSPPGIPALSDTWTETCRPSSTSTSSSTYATHKHAKVKAWLAQRPRYHVHYTPTYASWRNQIERWFGLITQQAIRRGSFSSVKDLVTKIDHFVEHDHAHSRPFVWTATASQSWPKFRDWCMYLRDGTLATD